MAFYFSVQLDILQIIFRGFYSWTTQPKVTKHQKMAVNCPDNPQSHHAQITMLQ